MASNRTLIKQFFFIATIVLAVPATAQPVPHGLPLHHGCGEDAGPPVVPPGMPAGLPGAVGGPVPPFLHGAHLSEAQRDKVFSILYAQLPLLREQFKASRKAQDELRGLAASDGYDEAKAKLLAEASARAQAAIALLRARGLHRIYALLTPEQRSQMEADGPVSFPSPGKRGGRGR